MSKLAALVFLFPVVAFAEEGTDLVPTTTTEKLIGLVLTLLIPALVKMFRDWKKDNADRHLATIQAAASLAYGLTEEAKRLWPEKVPNALLFAEGEFLRILALQGIAPTPEEVALAKVAWGANHGLRTAQAELVAKAPTLNPSAPLPQLP